MPQRMSTTTVVLWPCVQSEARSAMSQLNYWAHLQPSILEILLQAKQETSHENLRHKTVNICNNWQLYLKCVILLSTVILFYARNIYPGNRTDGWLSQQFAFKFTSFINCHFCLSIQLLNVQLPTAEEQIYLLVTIQKYVMCNKSSKHMYQSLTDVFSLYSVLHAKYVTGT